MKVEDGYYIDDFWHEMLPGLHSYAECFLAALLRM